MYRVQGIDIHVLEAGPTVAGSPILFLHGNPDTSEVWQPTIDRLVPKGIRCIAPDLPGFGRSGSGDAFDCSLQNQGSFVEELLVKIGVGPQIHLVVHDVGGAFGLSFAVLHPERLKSLTILNTTFTPEYQWHTWARVWRAPILGELSMALMNRLLFRTEVKRGSVGISVEEIDRTYDRITPSAKRMVLRWYRAMDPSVYVGWDLRLREVIARVPTEVLWGVQDPYIPLRFADQFGIVPRRLPGSGHWVQLEATDVLVDSVLATWQRLERPT